jgi:starvation-inducible DNA-binding protein
MKFEEIYTDAFVKIDEITVHSDLNEIPLHSFSSHLKQSEVKEVTGVADERVAMKETLSNLQIILVNERSLLELAKSAKDESIITLINSYNSQQEKLVWMY